MIQASVWVKHGWDHHKPFAWEEVAKNKVIILSWRCSKWIWFASGFHKNVFLEMITCMDIQCTLKTCILFSCVLFSFGYAICSHMIHMFDIYICALSTSLAPKLILIMLSSNCLSAIQDFICYHIWLHQKSPDKVQTIVLNLLSFVIVSRDIFDCHNSYEIRE